MDEFTNPNQSSDEQIPVFTEEPVFAQPITERAEVNAAASQPDTVPASDPTVYVTPVRANPSKKEPVSRFHLPTVIVSVVLAVVVGTVSGFLTASTVSSANRETLHHEQTAAPGTTGDVNITVDETVNSSIEAVATKVTPSVVGIRTTAAVQSFFGGSTEATGEGSGIVYSADGYIITNYHVIESAVQSARSSIEVYFSGNDQDGIPATVVGYNISCDLAVVKVDKTGLPSISLADMNEVKVGQYCVAIGSPGGLQYMGSVTNGIVSGLNRHLENENGESDVPLIQTNAAINPGNSGGALVNLQGELIGVNSSKIVANSFEGMGFAIPVDKVKDVCDKIIAKEYDPDPYVGLTFSETWTAERLTQYGYPAGAVVRSVNEGGPGAAAGIRSSDIITEFNGKSVDSVDRFGALLDECKPGNTVVVKFYRAGRYYSTSVTIGSNNSQ